MDYKVICAVFALGMVFRCSEPVSAQEIGGKRLNEPETTTAHVTSTSVTSATQKTTSLDYTTLKVNVTDIHVKTKLMVEKIVSDDQSSTSTQSVTTETPVTTSTAHAQTTGSMEKKTTRKATTPVPTSTESVPENCMISRKEEFKVCLEALGRNAMKYFASQNMTAFLDELCDSEMSKPQVECIKRHFRDCPAFLERPEVTALKFGPYHIKDIHYFDTVDQMCRCSSGLVCINKLLETKRRAQLTLTLNGAPWSRMPNFTAICEHDTARYIGCVRQNLRRCQAALNRRYGDQFTHSDAEDVKGMYDFTMVHCDTVKTSGFSEKYSCIEKASTSPEMNRCVRRADRLPAARQTCEVRECVRTVLEPVCEPSMVSLYIDAVNIYTHSSTKLLNFPCAAAASIAASLVTLVATLFMVLLI